MSGDIMEYRILHKRKEGGFAVVLGIIILFAATITGMALLYLAGRDQSASTDTAKMRTTHTAAQSALQACIGKFETQPDSALKILQAYINDHSKCWILNSPSEAKVKRPFDLTSLFGTQKYSARIVGYDPHDNIIQIEGVGEGSSDAYKSIIGVYKLFGVGVEAVAGWALYLNHDSQNFDNKIEVVGDMYACSGFHFNGGANGSIVRGNFKAGDGNDVFAFDGGVTFHKNLYIQSNMKVNGGANVIINGLTGIVKNMHIDGNFSCNNRALYMGLVNAGNAKINMNNNQVTCKDGALSNSILDASSIEVDNSLNNNTIANALDFNTGDETPWQVDLSGIPSSKIISMNNENELCAERLDYLYSNSDLYEINGKQFLVLKLDKNNTAAFKNTVGATCDPSIKRFSNNVIWIVEGTLYCNSTWALTDANSKQLVVVKDDGLISGLGGANINGYLHVKDNGKIIYSLLSNACYSQDTIRGAMHHVSDSKDSFQINNSNNFFIIIYDPNLLNDFMVSGIINTGNGNNNGAINLKLTDVKIRAQLVSISY
jgi:hypothetical protein